MTCLQCHFGHSQFRPTQWQVIRTLIEKRDCCCVMATGYGMSLCYLFPDVSSGSRMTLVVSPLISLMQDQVLAFGVAGIEAAFLGSGQRDNTGVVQRCADGNVRVLYVSPEYVGGQSGDALLRSIAHRLQLLAIDEAHCVSQWGLDFRHSYRQLGKLRERIAELGGSDRRVPLLAVTATAKDRVRADICESLRLAPTRRLVCTSFDRSNLEFLVRPKTTVWADLGPFVRAAVRKVGVMFDADGNKANDDEVKATAGSCIAYCIVRKDTEWVAQVLLANGVVSGTTRACR